MTSITSIVSRAIHSPVLENIWERETQGNNERREGHKVTEWWISSSDDITLLLYISCRHWCQYETHQNIKRLLKIWKWWKHWFNVSQSNVFSWRGGESRNKTALFICWSTQQNKNDSSVPSVHHSKCNNMRFATWTVWQWSWKEWPLTLSRWGEKAAT